MTISRYYTPSGRLIQTPYEGGDLEKYYDHKSLKETTSFSKSEYVENIPDSLRFYTANKRVVYGGGGILPDYIIPVDTLSSEVATAVLGASLDQQFAREWFETHEQEFRDEWSDRKDDFVESFEVSTEIWDAFWEFNKEMGIEVTENESAVDTASDVYSMADVESQRETFEIRLKALIARQLYGRGVWQPIVNSIDKEINEAMKLWVQAQDLAVYNK